MSDAKPTNMKAMAGTGIVGIVIGLLSMFSYSSFVQTAADFAKKGVDQICVQETINRDEARTLVNAAVAPHKYLLVCEGDEVTAEEVLAHFGLEMPAAATAPADDSQ